MRQAKRLLAHETAVAELAAKKPRQPGEAEGNTKYKPRRDYYGDV